MPTKQSRINFINRIYSLLTTYYSLLKSLRHLLFIVKIEGESAWPELIPEKYYFATSLLRPKTGRFFIFKKDGRIIVKKIEKILDKSVEVSAAVSWGSSSKNLGILPLETMIGTVIL